MDSWSKIQLQRIKNGRNGKLRKFWKDQNFHPIYLQKENVKIQNKYHLLVINQFLEIK